MEKYCPVCGKITPWNESMKDNVFTIRGEKIQVEGPVLSCTVCQTEFEDMGSDSDPYSMAYKKFRTNRGMIQPEEIKKFRRKYNLTQKELSELLGIGEITISRYENGALQDDAHDRLLKFIFSPSNLLSTIYQKKEVLPTSKANEVLSLLQYEVNLESYTRYYQDQKEDLDSGNRLLDIEKVFEVIRFFTYSQTIFKTKLLKLLFYADFKSFKEYKISITGLKYAHFPLGPVPFRFYDLLGTTLNIDNSFVIREESIGEYCGEILLSQTPPSINLTEQEISILRKVQDHFSKYSAAEMVEFSHQEKGYEQTQYKELISYAYAKDLQI